MSDEDALSLSSSQSRSPSRSHSPVPARRAPPRSLTPPIDSAKDAARTEADAVDAATAPDHARELPVDGQQGDNQASTSKALPPTASRQRKLQSTVHAVAGDGGGDLRATLDRRRRGSGSPEATGQRQRRDRERDDRQPRGSVHDRLERPRGRDADLRGDRGGERGGNRRNVTDRLERLDTDSRGDDREGGGRYDRDRGRGDRRRPDDRGGERSRGEKRAHDEPDDRAAAQAPRNGDRGAATVDADAGASTSAATAAAAAATADDDSKKKDALPSRGGVYIPPFRLKQMMAAAAEDKASEQYQRMMWEALRKSLNGVINKVNSANIKAVLPELFRENLVRGQGLLCQSLMKAQAASVAFTPVFAALVAVVNTKFPEIGLLVCARVLQQFKVAYRRSDKPLCITALEFIAHLTSQKLLPELLAVEVRLALSAHTSDSFTIAHSVTISSH